MFFFKCGNIPGEEGSHFDGSVSPCHQSDDEWEGEGEEGEEEGEREEPHGDPGSCSEVTSMTSEVEALAKQECIYVFLVGVCEENARLLQ